MANHNYEKRSTWVWRLFVLGGLFLVAGLLCISICNQAYTEKEIPSLTQAQDFLNRSLTELRQQEEYLRYESYKLSDDITDQLRQGRSDRFTIYKKMENYIPELRLAMLYQNNRPWTWVGNIRALPSLPIAPQGSLETTVFIDPVNKSFVFQSELESISTDSLKFRLTTHQKLPIQFRLITGLFDQKPSSNQQALNSDFVVNLAVNYVPPRDSLLISSPLTLQGQDSIGVAYIPPSTLNKSKVQIPDSIQWLNLTLLSFALLFLFIASWIWSTTREEWTGLFIKVGLWMISGILIFGYLRQMDTWILLPKLDWNDQSAHLLEFNIFALLATAISTTIISVLYYKRRLYGFTWYPRTIFASLLFGVFAAVILVSSAHYTLSTVELLGADILNLSILPDAENFVLQISAGFLWGALLGLITTLSWFLFNSEEDQLRWVPPFTLAGFLSTILLYYITRSEVISEVYLILLIAVVGMTLCTFIGYSFHKYALQWRFISRARFYALAIFFVALGTYILFSYGAQTQLRKSLTYSAEQAAALPIGTEQAVAGILSESIEQELQQKRLAYGATAYPLETQLRYELEKQTKRLEDRYVIQAYILDSRERLIALASTGLSSLTFSELQSVMQSNGNNSSGSSQNGNRHLGWSSRQLPQGKLIVNVETRHAEREQPLSFPFDSDDRVLPLQTPVQMLVYYQDGNLVSIESRGNTHTFPIQQKLATSYEEPVWKEFPTDHGTFLSYIYPLASVDQTIMVMSRIPSWQQHLYLLFRYYLVLLIGGLLLLQILSWLGILEASIYRKNERFRNRIIDSYLIATLTFLVILTVATHVIMQQQQRSQVEQRLMETLDQLSETLPKDITSINDQRLLRYSTPFQIDALLYHQAKLKHSTYPELVTNGWFTSILPFDIYHQLFELQQKRSIYLQPISAATPNLSLLYSFQRLNQDSDWVIAIPAILDRSRIDQQMLQTITYLLVIYVFIFGLFMLSAAMIARELTRPLLYFQSGLKRISSGKLDTTIPVTTQDEIGSLAHAYNVMVYKLKDLRKELAEAERQAAWTEMARQVAHEIKNPLTPMKLQLQHLNRMITSGRYDIEELKPKASEITSTLVDQIQSLSNIASDFSRFAKPFETELEMIDLNNLLHDIDQLYRHDERIHIEPDLADENLPILAAKDELKRVFINLVKNASEAMPHGGVIMLRSYQHKDFVYVDVVDNGYGISEEYKSKIFVPNFSTKTSGTGLGLAISKKIVEAHQGEIDFASVPGSGTTFTISLPLNGFH